MFACLRVCEKLALDGPRHLVAVRSVDQRFNELSRKPFFDAVIRRLESITYYAMPDHEQRYRVFQRYSNALIHGAPDYLPGSHRLTSSPPSAFGCRASAARTGIPTALNKSKLLPGRFSGFLLHTAA